MDYQNVPKSHNHFMVALSLLIFSLLPFSVCIVNRDLVLTPKQGLQLSGKRIFYEESFNNDKSILHHNNNSNDSVTAVGTRPWERTLKHVTYLTLFTNAANGIITGNFSKVKEYNDFLTSNYIHSPKAIDSRFGDIVTLAQGRLETMANGSYRFVEGNCDYECARESNLVAMWHVQKIRHRDTADRKYHYEMKFSVSPMSTKTPTETVVRGGPNKRTIMEERRNNVQTFIQKEDDYPNSFRRIVSDKDEDFTERRYESARNFRQVSPHYAASQQQVTPIPQSTFLRGVYQPPPVQNHLQHKHLPPQQTVHPQHQAALYHPQQHLPLPERLNIGEFYKGNYVPKSSPKADLFPNLLSMFMGKPQHPPPPHLPPASPTTFRPSNYQMKFARPDVYNLPHHSQEFSKFPEYQHPSSLHSQEQYTQRPPSTVPMVTHHYHHHYFMPNNSAISIEQAFHHSSEQNQEQPMDVYHNEVTEIAIPQGYVTGLSEEPYGTTTLKQQHNFAQPHHYQNENHYTPNFPQQNFHKNYHHPNNIHFPQVAAPAPQKFVFTNTQIEPQRVVHVTPVPPLKKPQYQQEQQREYENRPFTSSLEYTTVHVPLLISYPAPISEEERADVPTPRNKPFVQSDPIEDTIHYSEPDPLYANINEAEIGNGNKYNLNTEDSPEVDKQEPQLESPEENYDPSTNSQQQNDDPRDNKKEHSESIEAQVPPPKKNLEENNEEVKTPEESPESQQSEPEQNTSQTVNTIQVANEKSTTTEKSTKTESSNTIVSSTKRPKLFSIRTKRIKPAITTAKPSTTSLTPTKNSATESPKSLSTTSKPRKNFVSTSTSESPLRTISRYRNSYARSSSTSTTTTEKPVLKWTPKRKASISKFVSIKSTTSATNASGKFENLDDSEDNDVEEENENSENEDIKTNESNNLRKVKKSLITATTTVDDLLEETSTDMPNTITIGISTTVSPLTSSSTTTASALLSQTAQAETEIYEVLTQKSVSKSVSLKVGSNGEEIPVIVDDEENEVKRV